MVAHISSGDAQAWVDRNRLHIDDEFLANDGPLELQIEETIIDRLKTVFDVSGWTTSANTPLLVRTAIAMKYVAAVYRRQISQTTVAAGFRTYSDWLEQNSMLLVQGLLDATFDIGQTIAGGQPAFYPTDSSSAMDPTSDDRSLGDAHFSMGMVF